LLDQLGRGEVAGYVNGTSLPATQTIAATLRHSRSLDPNNARGWMRRVVRYVEAHRASHAGTLQKLVAEAVSSQKAAVDAAVTTDIHRVFRLPGTLHGTSGMCKLRVDSIDLFDPRSDPVVLRSDAVKVDISFYPRFSIRGEDYGPFKSETAALPTYAAVPILTQGFGEVA